MVRPQDRLRQCVGFEWDAGDDTKNWDAHDVSRAECEEVFFNRPLMLRRDREHSMREPRYYALGVTMAGRLLFVAFTVREKLVRVISARDMTAREKQRYNQ